MAGDANCRPSISEKVRPKLIPVVEGPPGGLSAKCVHPGGGRGPASGRS